ncbi:sodium:phosphate symporter [Haloplanus aerogenes]|uniref:Sodium-dependent phosphate cotransporter n=1 Tax=Haloplanus aerogenes TaxID=660522 RepID=A0A3M0CG80_9EURY|nr:sodium:phosphate symporter [Haloplanus aerogenes]AZH24811.1 sodium:phosphate symporter [Haloplanus aerogenes]RMB08352.1 sodium-dependent phosphate cotransporter [Haloplanus aerogenes]
MLTRLAHVLDRLASSRLLPIVALGGIVLFLFAVRLLGTATDAAAPLIERVFVRIVVGDAAALGLGWLGAYVLANGSVIAAVAVSLFTADIVSPPQLFLLVAGSRLGAAAIVVFVGTLDYVQKAEYSLRKSVSMGLLTFLLTLSIYLPVTVIGYLALPSLQGPFRAVSRGWSIDPTPLAVFDPLTVAITTRIGPLLSVLLAVAVLFGSLNLFDRLLGTVDTTTLRQHVFSHFQRTSVSFVLGLVVTGVTTSVAFSLGVIVPLYNRGYVERDELIPYVLGANLGTLLDTLLVAVVLDSAIGVAVVLELLVIATVVTLGALAVRGPYSRFVVAVDERLLTDRSAFLAFVALLVLAPLALLLVPLVLR